MTAEHNKAINRRTLLRGAGIALGLPLLEAMTPLSRSAFSSDLGVAPVRMACIFFPNGAIMRDWKPTVDDGQWTLSKSLQPLARHRQDLNVISGLALDNGRAKGDGAGDHARCGSTFLTAARPTKTSGRIRIGVSVDQVAASQLTDVTRLPSIELGLVPSRNAGDCDSGYSCAYSSNISWRNETQPMPKEVTPRLAFERMFGSGESVARRKRDFERKSILDVVSADAEKIFKQVGQSDQRKLDEYFSGLREIERRIEHAEREDQQVLPELDVPFGRVDAFRDHARLMYDLMVVGFQTDTTRVATFMLDNAGGNRRYPEIGVKEAHHELSHHRNKNPAIEKLQAIDKYLVEQFGYFLDRLAETSDSNGRLLDQSLVLYGSGLSDSNRHDHGDLPIVLAGSGGGQLDTGRYIQCAGERPMANLFLSLLDMMGTPADSIGDSTGRLSELHA